MRLLFHSIVSTYITITVTNPGVLNVQAAQTKPFLPENINISGVRMTDIPTMAISFDLYYSGKSVSEMLAEGGGGSIAQSLEVTKETPLFKKYFHPRYHPERSIVCRIFTGVARNEHREYFYFPVCCSNPIMGLPSLMQPV
ncbi:MAG: hypothetical protein EOM73_08630 [Bacteroidia bacterium]|nr:hypothetical protein [Bacteroidia bacterium]